MKVLSMSATTELLKGKTIDHLLTIDTLVRLTTETFREAITLETSAMLSTMARQTRRLKQLLKTNQSLLESEQPHI